MKLSEIIEYCCYRVSKFYMWGGEKDIYPIRGTSIIFGAILCDVSSVIIVFGVYVGLALSLITRIMDALLLVYVILTIWFGTEKRFVQAQKKYKSDVLLSGWLILGFIVSSYLLFFIVVINKGHIL